MNSSPIKIAALKRGFSLKLISGSAGINSRRFYRLIEGLAVPTEEELTRIATVTGLSLDQVREALTTTSASVRQNG